MVRLIQDQARRVLTHPPWPPQSRGPPGAEGVSPAGTGAIGDRTVRRDLVRTSLPPNVSPPWWAEATSRERARAESDNPKAAVCGAAGRVNPDARAPSCGSEPVVDRRSVWRNQRNTTTDAASMAGRITTPTTARGTTRRGSMGGHTTALTTGPITGPTTGLIEGGAVLPAVIAFATGQGAPGAHVAFANARVSWLI